jgi:hypothetical protein
MLHIPHPPEFIHAYIIRWRIKIMDLFSLAWFSENSYTSDYFMKITEDEKEEEVTQVFHQHSLFILYVEWV